MPEFLAAAPHAVISFRGLVQAFLVLLLVFLFLIAKLLPRDENGVPKLPDEQSQRDNTEHAPQTSHVDGHLVLGLLAIFTMIAVALSQSPAWPG